MIQYERFGVNPGEAMHRRPIWDPERNGLLRSSGNIDEDKFWRLYAGLDTTTNDRDEATIQ